MKRWKNEPGVGKSKSGNQGPAGPTGPAGRDGVDGAPGREGIDGAPGRDGRDGRDGSDGKSAYQIAVEGGFAGTEAEWVTSLKGADGQDGRDGRDGVDGVDAHSRRTDVQSGVTNASGVASFVFDPPFKTTPHVSVTMVHGSTREYHRITSLALTGCTVHAYSQNATLLSLLGLDILTAGTTNLGGRHVSIMAVEQ